MAFEAIVAFALFCTSLAMQSHQALEDPEPKTCKWRGLYREDICAYPNVPRAAAFKTGFEEMHIPRVGIPNVTQLFNDVQSQLRWNPSLRLDFFAAWDKIKNLQAVDVLATKETWSEHDTKLLQKLVKGAQIIGRDGPRNLTTEAIKERLPSLQDLYFKAQHSLAFVSNGPSLKEAKLGDDIDRHDIVVKFDDQAFKESDQFAGTLRKQQQKRLGTKYGLQVGNAKTQGTADIPLFDLDGGSVLRSYCQRLFEDGMHPRTVSAELYLFTPTAFCTKLPKDVESFSKSFLFYWLFGSLAKEVSLYGVLDSSAASQLNKPRFHEAEQLVYQMAAAQWKDGKHAGPAGVRGLSLVS